MWLKNQVSKKKCCFICLCLVIRVGLVSCPFVVFCSQQLETDLKIEREWRQTLQSDLGRERDTVTQLSTEALQINGLKKVKSK